MIEDSKIKIFLVDDDIIYLRLLEIEFLQHADFIVESFATGESCIEKLSQAPDIIILDYYLDSIDKHAMNGIEVLDKIKIYNPDIPVVMLSSDDKIDVAINCMDHKAIDYVVKSETAFIRLQMIISTIIQNIKLGDELILMPENDIVII
jgi:two-component system, OmpR family, response regulator